MRHRTPVLIITATLLLGGCGTAANDDPARVATPPSVSVSAAPAADTPSAPPDTALPSDPTTVDPGADTTMPEAPAPPTGDHGGASAQCKDGTLSYSAHHRGTCSHHGGVAVWYR